MSRAKFKQIFSNGKQILVIAGTYNGYAYTFYPSTILNNKLVIVKKENRVFKHVLTLQPFLKKQALPQLEELPLLAHDIINGLPELDNLPSVITSTGEGAHGTCDK